MHFSPAHPHVAHYSQGSSLLIGHDWLNRLKVDDAHSASHEPEALLLVPDRLRAWGHGRSLGWQWHMQALTGMMVN